MLKQGVLRLVIGLVLGLMGGLSLTLTVFPFVTGQFLDMPTFDFTRLFGYAGPIALLWAGAGSIVGWYGGLRTGLLVLGVCGAVTGFVLGTFALGGDAQLMWGGTLVGLAYGLPAGLIVGLAFANSVEET